MARRARFLLAVLLTTLLLAACGGQEQGGQSKEKAAAPETTAETTSEATTRAIAETTTETTQTASPPSSKGTAQKAGPATKAEVTVTVTHVVDGDTIKISPAINGTADVRLIGVDTPETKKPNCAPQPYGAEASAFTTAQLQGHAVGLEFDVEKTDRYDRLLAYVYPPEGTMFNETLLREGYAQLATFPPNVKYVERFQEAQAEARAASKGLWGQSPEQLAQQTDRGNGIGGDGCTPPQTNQPPRQQRQQPEPTPDPAQTPPAAPPVIPGGARCADFATEAEAIAALPSNPQLDRDGDGRACESLP